jgi:hypothetical protein
MKTATVSLLSRSLRSWLSRDATLEGPRWMLWMWTLLLCAAIALGFTLLGLAVNASNGGDGWKWPHVWARYFGINMLVSTTIGVIAHLMFDTLIPWIGVERIRRFSPGQRAAFYSAVPLLAVSIGWFLALWLFGDAFGGPKNAGEILSSFFVALLISFIVYLVFSAKAQ